MSSMEAVFEPASVAVVGLKAGKAGGGARAAASHTGSLAGRHGAVQAAFMLAPTLPGELDKAVARLRCAPLLNGHGGRVPVDRRHRRAAGERS